MTTDTDLIARAKAALQQHPNRLGMVSVFPANLRALIALARDAGRYRDALESIAACTHVLLDSWSPGPLFTSGMNAGLKHLSDIARAALNTNETGGVPTPSITDDQLTACDRAYWRAREDGLPNRECVRAALNEYLRITGGGQ